MEIKHIAMIQDQKMRSDVLKIVELCDEEFIPSLSERRRTAAAQTKQELLDMYMREKDT